MALCASFYILVTIFEPIPVDRLANYIVSVALDPPPVNDVSDLDGYARCGQYQGTPPSISSVVCAAGTIGRYLYVYLPSTNYLTLCEVVVFGRSKKYLLYT